MSDEVASGDISVANEDATTASARTNRFRSWLPDTIGVIVAITCTTVGQLFLFAGPQPFDPTYYVKQALAFPHDHLDYWALRIGIIFPLKLITATFGYSPGSLFGLMFISNGLLAASCYGIMMLLLARQREATISDRVIAIAAAVVVLLNQDYLLNSTALFPDPIETAVFAAGFFFLMLGSPWLRPETSKRAATIYELAAGFLFGYSYLVREFSPLLAPAVLLAMAVLGYRRRSAIRVVIGVVAAYAIEFFFDLFKYHDPFERIKILLKKPPNGGRRLVQWEPFRQKVHNPIQAFLVLPRLLHSWADGWTMLLILALAIVTVIVMRDRRLTALFSWTIGYWIVMTILGVLRKKNGDLFVEVGNIRYWDPIIPAIVMGAVLGVALFVRKYGPMVRQSHRLWLAMSATIAVALSLLVVAPGAADFNNCNTSGAFRANPLSRWDGFRTFMSGPIAAHYDILTTKPIPLRTVNIYLHSDFGHKVWQGTSITQLLDAVLPATPDPARTLYVAPTGFVHRPAGIELLRHGWKPLWVSPDGKLAVLAFKPTVGGVTRPVQHHWVTSFRLRHKSHETCGNSPYEAFSG